MPQRSGWLWIGMCVIALAAAGIALQRTVQAQNEALPGKARPELILQNGHVKAVTALVFSPDGETLASAGQDKTVKLWSVRSGALRQALTGHQGAVLAVAFSKDGKILLTGSQDGTVKAWSAATGRFFGTLYEAHRPLTAIALWPGDPGKEPMLIAAADADRTITLWSAKKSAAEPGETVAALKGHEKRVGALAFSPDGKWLVSGDDAGRLKEWDTADGALQRTLISHALPINGVTFAPDSKTFADASEDGISQLWETETGKKGIELQLNAPGDGVGAVAFSVDGKAATGGDGGRRRNEYIKLWDAKAGKETHVLKGSHEAYVTAVAFTPNGRWLASGSRDSTIRLWDAQTGNPLHRLGETDRIFTIAFAPHGATLASGSADGAARLWNAQTGALLHAFLGHTDFVRSVVYSPDGKILATGSRDSTIKLWTVESGALLATLPAQGPVRSLAFSADGTMLASGQGEGILDGSIRLWAVADRKLLHTLEGESLGQVNSVAFAPDGSVVASASRDATLRLWDTRTGKQLKKEYPHRDDPHKENDPEIGFSRPIRSVVFSADGKTLLSGSVLLNRDGDTIGDQIEIWNGKTMAFQSKRTALTSNGGVNEIAFLPDQKSVVSAGGDGRLRLWKIRTEEMPQALAGHESDVLTVAVSSDGSRIAGAGLDNTIRIWNTGTGRMLATLLPLPAREKENSRTEWLALTPEGYFDGSVGASRYIQWRVGPDLFPVEAYEQSLHRPDLLRKGLMDQPLPDMPVAQQFAAGSAVPPHILFLRLRNGQKINGNMLHVNGLVTEKPGTKVQVRLLVNGRPVEGKLIELGAKPLELGAKLIELGAKPLELGAKPLELGAKPLELGAKPIPAEHKFCQEFQADVVLPPGEEDVTLTAIAYDAENLAAREEIRLTRTEAKEAKAGTLYVLAIGVSKYQNPKFNLKYAGRDADTFADLWKRKGAALYQKVEIIRLLDDQATTANVRAALFKLIETVKEQDSVALFLSGHGVQANEQDYYFATHEIDPATEQRVKETALPWTAFETTLTSVRAKRIFLFLDACHSGNALGAMQAYNERLAEPLVKRAGVMVFASSRGSELSYEVEAAQHGAFTSALVEGLDEGKADFEVNGIRDGIVTAEELLAYLRARVPQMTENRQTPSCPLLRDFGEAFPLTKTK